MIVKRKELSLVQGRLFAMIGSFRNSYGDLGKDRLEI